MIGQQKLMDRIDIMTSQQRLPRFAIVVGARGMEHEDVARYIATQLDASYIQLEDVKVDTIRNMISEAYRLHSTTVYCIPNADDMSINAKNAMLKVVEDAPNKAYFVMCLEDMANTLATIRSRGVELRMEYCKPSDIADFARSLYVNKSDIKEDTIKLFKELCRTPGDVIYFTQHSIENFYNYAKYVSTAMFELSGAEVFKLSEKLALKDEDDKYDLRLFARALQLILLDAVTSDSASELTKKRFKVNACISHYIQDLKIKGINKSMLWDNMILEVRKIWKSQS